MTKLMLGIVLGTILGFFDGLTAWFTPEVRDQMMTIIMGSTFKGVLAGVAIGFFAKKVNSLPLGILFGLGIAFLITLPIALAEDPVTGQTYFWKIILPGSLVGAIVGYATQKYGVRQKTANV